MELDINGTNARLYRWFYRYQEMPGNLCPYFWKLVTMWIFILPLSLICLPAIIIKSTRKELWAQKIAVSIVIYIALFVVFVAIFSPVTLILYGWFKENGYQSMQVGGILTWGVVIICLIVWRIVVYLEIRKEKRQERSNMFIWNDEGDYVPNPNYVKYNKKPNIIIEFIKAKYKRYCPQIVWKGEE